MNELGNDPVNDPVNHPAHYTTGRIECIDFITDKRLNFCRGNAVKYIVRAGIKDPATEIEDLEKAIWYLRREISDLRMVHAPERLMIKELYETTNRERAVPT